MSDTEWRRELESDVIELKGTVSRIKKDLYNGDDSPDSGLVPRLVKLLTIGEERESRKWTRSQKIATLAVILPLLSLGVGYVGKSTVDWFGDVSAIVHEWHEVHKTQNGQKTLFVPTDPNVSSKQQPQFAGN